jgi:hypothetical protein
MIAPGDLDVRAPIAGESLDGFIAEVVSENGLQKVRHVSRAGGIVYGHRPQLTTTGWTELPALAELLGVDVEELRLRSHPFIGVEGSRRVFFGTTVHRADLRSRVRFFSPAALVRAEHHRAMWQLRFPFDLETGELLVSTCPRPSCLAVQRWRHSAGVRYCDTCVEDLAKHVPPRLDDDLLSRLRPPMGLTHVDPAIRAASVRLLPDGMRRLGADMAFELLLRLVPVIHPACQWKPGSRLWDNDPFEIANGMLSAWETMLGWPGSLIARMSTHLKASPSRYSDGNGGRTIAFLRLRAGEGIPNPVAAFIGGLYASLDVDGAAGERLRNLGLDCHEASAVTGISTSVIAPLRREGVFRTVPVISRMRLVPFYDRAEMIALDRDIDRRCDLSHAASALGLPYYALEQLHALGRFERLSHPFFAARYAEPQIAKDAVHSFSRLLVDRAVTGLVAAVPLLSASRMVGARLKPWDAIVEALLSGELPFEHRAGREPLFARLSVRREDLRGPISKPITRDGASTTLSGRMATDFPLSDLLTRRDAGEVLNLGTSQYTRLFADVRGQSGRVLPVRDVLRLAVEHVASVELAERLGTTHQQVSRQAAARGLRPLSPAGFHREEAERAFRQLSVLGSDDP